MTRRVGAVVGQEDDQRVVPGAHLADLLEHAADLAVHAVDHGRVDGHLGGLELLLLGRQVVPGDGVLDLAGAEHVEPLRA